MPDEYAAFILLLMFGAPVLWSKIDKAAAKKLEPFELELYKRCQEAGLGDAVETKEEIQQAGEIAQTLASEKAFSRKIKKRHLKAEWLNKRLKNGKPLFAKETEARQEAEESRRRAQEARQRAVAERTRLFNAFPHYWGSGEWREYLLQYDSIEYFDRKKNERESAKISLLDKVEIKDSNGNYYITVASSCLSSWIFLSTDKSTEGVCHPTNEQMQAMYTYLVKYSAMSEEAKARLLSNPNDLVGECRGYYNELAWKSFAKSYAGSVVYGSGKSKDASVVGRAAAGWAIAGPAGGVIGALSAVDKNNKNSKK